MTTTQAHKQYMLNTGDPAPGVTTILSVLAKPFLVKWANNLGLKGIDSTKYKDKMADIGTITHLLILAEFTRKHPDFSEYANADIEQANQCFAKFKVWETAHKCEPLIVETPMASDIYGYGGTPDFIGKVNGELELIDFKTSNAIYTDNFLQIAAYRQLAKERGLDIKQARIIRVGKEAGQGFEDRLITCFDDEFETFLHCLGIYNLLKQMKRTL